MTDHPEERRAILRIHAVWRRLAEHRLPSASALDPGDFADDWSKCLILPIEHDDGTPRGLCEKGLDRTIPQHRLACALLALAQRHIARVLATGQPVGHGGTASYDGIDILYRIVLLPLSEDGTRMDAMLVGLTHREVPPASELRVSDIAWCKSPLNLARAGEVRQPADSEPALS